ncbi:acyltransferase family protein [Mucisphaera calidilacus]|uniref:Acyltransferase family protein n=1 Tax=Mucisphaera calidilacus TaxID=2527982 RepID=A0A518BWV0_9BACT|nr:acyltransferase [Mucisphaera calidilacus]QDU71453.1 Acyltransferase family protein [Mucisphaera calidilacus]
MTTAAPDLASVPSDRDVLIDVLRAIGLVMIVLAHTIPSGWTIFQLRNFDVPLMAFVAGMSFAVTAPERLSLGPYYLKRIGRLLVPTYTFLLLFFGITALCCWLIDQPFALQGGWYQTFMLTNHPPSIGYVWIIRVFVLLAATAPLLHWVWMRTPKAVFASSLIVAYAGYEVAFYNIPRPETVWVRTLLFTYIYFAISYALMFGVGMLCTRLSALQRFLAVIFFSIVFVICIFYFARGDEITLRMQSYKYPPRLYYVSWGMLMSLTLSLVLMRLWLPGVLMSAVRFLSSASLWIYLWHIAVLYIIRWHLGGVEVLKNHWIKFGVVLVTASLITLAHRLVFRWLSRRLEPLPPLAGFVRLAFLK